MMDYCVSYRWTDVKTKMSQKNLIPTPMVTDLKKVRNRVGVILTPVVFLGLGFKQDKKSKLRTDISLREQCA